MTEAELLKKVKIGLGISGDYQDELLQIHIDNAKNYMRDAGVLESVLNSNTSVGCILNGVVDSWNYSSGDLKYSEMFKQRVIQLATIDVGKPIQALTVYVPTDETCELFGWHNTTVGYAQNITGKAFTCTDEEIIKAKVEYADGSDANAENDSSGNRRKLIFGKDYLIIMPDTIYDTAQGKFVDNAGTTVIQVQKVFAESQIALETFYKAV